VWVPKRARRTNQLVTMLPRRLSETMGRAMKADRVLAEADTISRRDYELRASRSQPGLEAAPEQPQIPTGAGD
jgi:hypothetical protein